MIRIVAALAISVFLSGCSEGFVTFPVTEEAQRDIAEDVEIIRLDSSNIGSFTTTSRGHSGTLLPSGRNWDYRVDVGDILNVIVFDHPELTLPTSQGADARSVGFRVQVDGTFFFPFVGQVRASGRAPEDIRGEVTQRLAEFIPNPQVEIQVAAYNSQSVVVSGEVNTPNRQALTTVQLSLIEAVNAAGGLQDDADSSRVTVQREGRSYEVDLEGFLSAGITRNNPILRNGDVVNVPRRLASEAYLLGQIRRPDVIDLSLETVTLTQALTRQGGLDEARADARGIFVFRNRARGMTVFQLETSSPSGMLLGTRFVLEPGDVVYVVRAPLQRWNDSISRLLPTVQAISAFDRVTNGI
jgi:polysaccharide export outer membrane protein